jgi:hypothetical protein
MGMRNTVVILVIVTAGIVVGAWLQVAPVRATNANITSDAPISPVEMMVKHGDVLPDAQQADAF